MIKRQLTEIRSIRFTQEALRKAIILKLDVAEISRKALDQVIQEKQTERNNASLKAKKGGDK